MMTKSYILTYSALRTFTMNEAALRNAYSDGLVQDSQIRTHSGLETEPDHGPSACRNKNRRLEGSHSFRKNTVPKRGERNE